MIIKNKNIVNFNLSQYNILLNFSQFDDIIFNKVYC